MFVKPFSVIVTMQQITFINPGSVGVSMAYENWLKYFLRPFISDDVYYCIMWGGGAGWQYEPQVVCLQFRCFTLYQRLGSVLCVTPTLLLLRILSHQLRHANSPFFIVLPIYFFLLNYQTLCPPTTHFSKYMDFAALVRYFLARNYFVSKI